MQILIDNRLYNIKDEKENNLIEKLNYFETNINSLLKTVFIKLKKECVIIDENVEERKYLRFLYLTNKEKNLLEYILKQGYDNFYFIFRFKNSFSLILEEYINNDTKKYYTKFKIYEINGISLRTNQIIYNVGKQNILEFIFKDKYDILFSRGKNFLNELRLKDIISKNENFDYWLNFIFTLYLKELTKDNVFIKDILKDYIENKNKLYTPIEFKLLAVAKNKKHLLELKMSSSNRKKYTLFNKFNKISLNTAYSLIKVEPYIKENELTKLFIFEYDDFVDKENTRVEIFLEKYILSKNPNLVNRKTEIADYISLLKHFKNKEYFNFDIKNIMKEHDRLLQQYKKAQYKKEKLAISEDNVFLKLKMPKNIKILNNKYKLYLEGERQKNCVFTYIPKINKEKCMIYTMLENKNSYTIEIQKGKNGFKVAQIRGFANSKAPIEIEKYIKNIIKENNTRLGYKNSKR